MKTMKTRKDFDFEALMDDCVETHLTEFDLLEDLLKKNDITYIREDRDMDGLFDFHQLRSGVRIDEDEGGWTWDVICHRGSFGWTQGLLEMWGKNMDDPEGYLTAKECLKLIKERI